MFYRRDRFINLHFQQISFALKHAIYCIIRFLSSRDI